VAAVLGCQVVVKQVLSWEVSHHVWIVAAERWEFVLSMLHYLGSCCRLPSSAAGALISICFPLDVCCMTPAGIHFTGLLDVSWAMPYCAVLFHGVLD
jgi:hypothetical protein